MLRLKEAIANARINEAVLDEIGSFYVITKPTKDSTLADIVFQATIGDMFNQAKGGLKVTDVAAFVKGKSKAERLGNSLLARR